VNAETYSLVAGKEIAYSKPERLKKSSVTSWDSLRPWLRSLWALPVGFLIGVAGTMLHLIKTMEGVPIGLVIAFVMVGSMALALRVLRRSRGALYLMALAFIITVLQMAQKQPNGSQYVTNNDLSTYWVYGSIGLLALIVVFPRIRKATWSKSASGHR